MNIQLQNIIPVSEARVRLNEMVNRTRVNNPYVISKSGKPRVVMVDVAEYDELIKLKAGRELANMTKETRDDFAKFLTGKGLDIDKLTDEDAEKILLEEYLS